MLNSKNSSEETTENSRDTRKFHNNGTRTAKNISRWPKNWKLLSKMKDIKQANKQTNKNTTMYNTMAERQEGAGEQENILLNKFSKELTRETPQKQQQLLCPTRQSLHLVT